MKYEGSREIINFFIQFLTLIILEIRKSKSKWLQWHNHTSKYLKQQKQNSKDHGQQQRK